jgi:hypothetical protein
MIALPLLLCTFTSPLSADIGSFVSNLFFKNDVLQLSTVTELTDLNFEDVIKSDTAVAVLFYASWCRFSQVVVPEVRVIL